MSVSPTRRAGNGADAAAAEAPHFRSVSQLAYTSHGYAKAEQTLGTHPKANSPNSPLNRKPVPFTGKSNAECSFDNTSSPPRRANLKFEQGLPKHQPFTANSESRDQFKAPTQDARRSSQHIQERYIQPIPFKGESESRKAFVDHRIKTVPPVKHDTERTIKNLPFTANSTMRESYTGESPTRKRVIN
eukprot:GILI01020617.1.p1 GENE.GILI01020617.1~~GILI01020617.1.p1  ORF type:complete len:188 (-),score=17.58 GILI01020617.1:103-666(-)